MKIEYVPGVIEDIRSIEDVRKWKAWQELLKMQEVGMYARSY